jgi:superoxide dismutase, Fe-Mn family
VGFEPTGHLSAASGFQDRPIRPLWHPAGTALSQRRPAAEPLDLKGYAGQTTKEVAMPWDELKAQRFPAFDKDLDGISRQTMEDHFKLYEGYAKKSNECRKLLSEFDYGEIEGNQVFSQLRAVSVDYTFALLGFKNHELYFGHLGGDGGEPTGRFAELVESEFHGGVDEWKKAVRKAARAARGWVLVGYDLNDGSIFNYILDTQNLWAVYNMVPVLAIDVYEHAYVRDFGATPDGRGEYVEALFRNLDWNHVNRQLEQAEAARQGAQSVGSEPKRQKVGATA